MPTRVDAALRLMRETAAYIPFFLHIDLPRQQAVFRGSRNAPIGQRYHSCAMRREGAVPRLSCARRCNMPILHAASRNMQFSSPSPARTNARMRVMFSARFTEVRLPLPVDDATLRRCALISDDRKDLRALEWRRCLRHAFRHAMPTHVLMPPAARAPSRRLFSTLISLPRPPAITQHYACGVVPRREEIFAPQKACRVAVFTRAARPGGAIAGAAVPACGRFCVTQDACALKLCIDARVDALMRRCVICAASCATTDSSSCRSGTFVPSSPDIFFADEMPFILRTDQISPPAVQCSSSRRRRRSMPMRAFALNNLQKVTRLKMPFSFHALRVQMLALFFDEGQSAIDALIFFMRCVRCARARKD